jgi:hypothetical protein
LRIAKGEIIKAEVRDQKSEVRESKDQEKIYPLFFKIVTADLGNP